MKHWTREDVTQWLYGLKEDSSHLDRCELCSAEAASAQSRRRELLMASRDAEQDVAQDCLAAQRRSIHQRLEVPQPSFWGHRVAASLALVLLAAVVSFKLLDRSANVPLASPSDVRLYSDMVAIDQSSEPRAIQPLENLFQE